MTRLEAVRLDSWEERKRRVLSKLHFDFEIGEEFDRPLVDDNTCYFASSLIDRGLADTRAFAIAKGLDYYSFSFDKDLNDADRVCSPILNCDTRNFRLLLDIEPRLIYLCLKHTGDRALIERLEGVLYD
jgi:hypothetical protein